MSDIYEQHKAAFPTVSAFVILDPRTGQRVATVALRFPTRGLRLWAWAYVHLIGTEMVRGSAGGGGYDKSSAAVAEAIFKIAEQSPRERDGGRSIELNDHRAALRLAATKMDAGGWDRELVSAGYHVLQAV